MKPSRKKGAFLVTVILMVIVLATMALAFAALAIRDSDFVRFQGDQAVAEELARSGIDYYLAYGLPGEPLVLDPEYPDRICKLEVKASFLFSRAEIGKSRPTIRTLCAPLWDLARVRSVKGVVKQ